MTIFEISFRDPRPVVREDAVGRVGDVGTQRHVARDHVGTGWPRDESSRRVVDQCPVLISHRSTPIWIGKSTAIVRWNREDGRGRGGEVQSIHGLNEAGHKWRAARCQAGCENPFRNKRLRERYSNTAARSCRARLSAAGARPAFAVGGDGQRGGAHVEGFGEGRVDAHAVADCSRLGRGLAHGRPPQATSSNGIMAAGTSKAVCGTPYTWS